jgi:hypothetical protein
MGLLTAIPEEVIEIRRIENLARYKNFILDEFHRMKGTSPYLHFLGGSCGN